MESSNSLKAILFSYIGLGKLPIAFDDVLSKTQEYGLGNGKNKNTSYLAGTLQYQERKFRFLYQFADYWAWYPGDAGSTHRTRIYSAINLVCIISKRGIIRPKGRENDSTGFILEDFDKDNFVKTEMEFSRTASTEKFSEIYRSDFELPDELKLKLLQYKEAIIDIIFSENGITIFSHKWLSDKQVVLKLMDLAIELEQAM